MNLSLIPSKIGIRGGEGGEVPEIPEELTNWAMKPWILRHGSEACPGLLQGWKSSLAPCPTPSASRARLCLGFVIAQ